MKLCCCFKRQYTSLSSPSSSSGASRIIDLCGEGDLFSAFKTLNSLRNQTLITPKIQPILFASLLQTSTKSLSFTHGLQIHSHVFKSGLVTDRFVGNSLLALYFKLGTDFKDTIKVFDGLIYRDVISWTSMISGYLRIGRPESSIDLFFKMLSFGEQPNAFTLSSMIKACSEIGVLGLGRCFHGVVIASGFGSNRVISSGLIDMYGRNYAINDARQMFDELPEPDPICWTSVISAYTRNDFYKQALAFFYLMQRSCGLMPDGFTFGTVLTACGNLGRLKQGREMHSKVITLGLCGNVVVESSLLDMYGKCGLVAESQRVFNRMSVKNSVSRSALLGVYCQAGNFEYVIELFKDLRENDVNCFGTVLRACAGLAAVRQGKEVHCQYVRRGGWRDIIVESALVDLYSKCGCINFAYRIFIQMPVRNLITWNSMISGFAQNGRGQEALRLFDKMIKEGIKPDYISFIAVISACNHTGLVDEGRKYFSLMINEYKIKAVVEHYNCMAVLLGRAGLLEEAESLIANSDCRKNSSLWAVILGACTNSTNSATAERIAKKMMELEPDNHLSYILLANLYKGMGRWNDAEEISSLMTDRRVKKTSPGKSWIKT
ncbi:hypothetical protein ACFE04_016958 [Oxalis oulophora]